jgi:Cu/Ag efflux pump CusA
LKSIESAPSVLHYGIGEKSRIAAPMIPMIGVMISSTLLSRLMIPVLYALVKLREMEN